MLACVRSSNSLNFQHSRIAPTGTKPPASPPLPLFPETRNRTFIMGVNRHDLGGWIRMGAMHQLMSASVAAAFSIGMLLAAHLFTEYRSSREAPIAIVSSLTSPL